MNSKQRVGSRWCWAAGKSCAGGCVRQPQEHRERLSLACAALAHYRLQRMQGEVYSGIKVGDISLTAGSGQQSEATVLEMVGDLLDSAGVCVQGVDVCSRNR
mgnify:CR=1 FL=1